MGQWIVLWALDKVVQGSITGTINLGVGFGLGVLGCAPVFIAL